MRPFTLGPEGDRPGEPTHGPEGDRPGGPTHAVRHTCSGNIKLKIAPHKQKSIVKSFFGKKMGPCRTGPCTQAHLSTMVNPALATPANNWR